MSGGELAQLTVCVAAGALMCAGIYKVFGWTYSVSLADLIAGICLPLVVYGGSQLIQRWLA